MERGDTKEKKKEAKADEKGRVWGIREREGEDGKEEKRESVSDGVKE